MRTAEPGHVRLIVAGESVRSVASVYGVKRRNVVMCALTAIAVLLPIPEFFFLALTSNL